IPHTHWEGAVFKTREGYLEMGLPNILKALRLLKMYELQIHARSGRLYQAVSRALSGGGTSIPQVYLGRKVGNCWRHGRDAGRREAGRRTVRAPDALRQALLPRETGSRGDHRLVPRHLRAPPANAATPRACGIQIVLVLPRLAAQQAPVGIPLARDRWHRDSCLLAPG